nr:MAG TPA: hypothetical protein [Caudoviricetes sp.]
MDSYYLTNFQAECLRCQDAFYFSAKLTFVIRV